METSDKVIFVLKVVIFAVVGVFAYQWYTGDKRITNHISAYMQKSGMQKKFEGATHGLASTYDKVIGNDLKKSNPAAVVGNVQEQLKKIQEAQKKKEQDLMNLENR